MHQILEGRHIYGAVEAAAALAFADVDGVRDVFERNGFGVILLDKIDGIFDAHFIRSHGSLRSFFFGNDLVPVRRLG